MENQKQNRIYLPIILLFSWFCFTILVFILGPWKYRLTQPFVFYSYLILVNMALLLGYIFEQREGTNVSKMEINYHRFVEISVTISIVYLIVKLILTRGGDIHNLIGTFRNAAEAYSVSSLKHTNLFSYLDILFTPVSVIAITNGIFCHKKLNIKYKFSIYFMIIVSITSSIGSATRAGIIQLFVISFAAFLLSFYKKNLIIRSYHKVLIFIFVIIAFIGYSAYSNFLVKTRYQVDTFVNPITLEQPKENYFLYKITPKDLHPLINSTSFYISHSYYRLNRALDLPLIGIGFGLSNSYFIIDNVEQYAGWSGLKKISYGMRLDDADGSGYGIFWSTFYTWIASDFTFPGSIIVILCIGYLFSLALNDSVSNSSPLAVTSFCTLFFLIFSFPFNNPLQDGAGITTNFIIPVLWLIFRKRSLLIIK